MKKKNLVFFVNNIIMYSYFLYLQHIYKDKDKSKTTHQTKGSALSQTEPSEVHQNCKNRNKQVSQS